MIYIYHHDIQLGNSFKTKAYVIVTIIYNNLGTIFNNLRTLFNPSVELYLVRHFLVEHIWLSLFVSWVLTYWWLIVWAWRDNQLCHISCIPIGPLFISSTVIGWKCCNIIPYRLSVTQHLNIFKTNEYMSKMLLNT